MIKINKLSFSIALISGITAAVPFAYGASDAQGAVALEEVIVTARRREESIQDVPVSIKVFSQDALVEAGITSAIDLAKVSPGLNVTADSGNAALPSFSIRGRGQNYGAAAGSVETYFADVPLSSPFQMPGLPVQFFDLASVQVLKGPQGTLFGRSTTGGAVLFVPQEPTDEFGGYARVQAGELDTRLFEGAVNIPLGDRAAFRLAGFYHEREGYMTSEPTVPENVAEINPALAGFAGVTLKDPLTGNDLTRQDFMNVDVAEVRGSLRLELTEDLQNTTILTYHRDKTRASPGGGLVSRALNPGSDLASPALGHDSYTAYIGVNVDKPESKAWAAINTTIWDITDDLTLKNIFGYIKAEGYTNDGADPDGIPIAFISVLEPAKARENEQYTNEIQLQGTAFDDKLNFTIGGLMDLTREPGDSNVLDLNPVSRGIIAGGIPDPAFPGTQPLIQRYQSNNFDNYSLFASGTYAINERLNLSIGYRHSWEDIEAIQGGATQTSAFAPLVESIPLSVNSEKFSGDSYNIELDYALDENTLIYGGLRHGWKRGGFNSSTTNPAIASFDQEEVDDWHLGLKKQMDFGGVTASFDVEVFHDIYDGLQVAYLSFDAGAGALITVSTNVPETIYQGLDMNFVIEPTDWLDISGAYTYLDAEFEDWPDTAPGSTIDLSQNVVPFVPSDKFTFSLRFHSEVGDLGEFVFRPSLSYQSEMATAPFNTVANLPQALVFGQYNHLENGGATVDDTTIIDLRAEWNNMMGSRVSSALTVTNLEDDIYDLGNSGTLQIGVQGNAYGAPRIITFELSTEF